MDLCDLEGDRSDLSGTSLAGLLKGTQESLSERMAVIQIGYDCTKWDQAVVMRGKWRLLDERKQGWKRVPKNMRDIKGLSLFNIEEDPAQSENVYDEYPEIAQAMKAHYNEWFSEARPLWEKERYATIGTDHENPLTLYANDWQGDYCDAPRNLLAATAKGYWDLIVDCDGTYEIELRRWPEESAKTLVDSYDGVSKEGAIPVAKVRLRIADLIRRLIRRTAIRLRVFRSTSKKVKPN